MKTVEFDPELMRKVTEDGQRILKQLMSMKTYSIKVDGKRMGTIQALDIFAACMAAWLVDGTPPPGFTIDRECELKSSDAMRSVVKYGRHRLDTEEVRQHIQTGKMPTATALTYRDRLSFVLRDTLQIKRVEFLDVVFENIKDVDAFDANVTVATGELALMLDELVDALGGEVKQ